MGQSEEQPTTPLGHVTPQVLASQSVDEESLAEQSPGDES
jgi:hypothetical protein